MAKFDNIAGLFDNIVRGVGKSVFDAETLGKLAKHIEDAGDPVKGAMKWREDLLNDFDNFQGAARVVLGSNTVANIFTPKNLKNLTDFEAEFAKKLDGPLEIDVSKEVTELANKLGFDANDPKIMKNTFGQLKTDLAERVAKNEETLGPHDIDIRTKIENGELPGMNDLEIRALSVQARDSGGIDNFLGTIKNADEATAGADPSGAKPFGPEPEPKAAPSAADTVIPKGLSLAEAKQMEMDQIMVFAGKGAEAAEEFYKTEKSFDTLFNAFIKSDRDLPVDEFNEAFAKLKGNLGENLSDAKAIELETKYLDAINHREEKLVGLIDDIHAKHTAGIEDRIGTRGTKGKGDGTGLLGKAQDRLDYADKYNGTKRESDLTLTAEKIRANPEHYGLGPKSDTAARNEALAEYEYSISKSYDGAKDTREIKDQAREIRDTRSGRVDAFAQKIRDFEVAEIKEAVAAAKAARPNILVRSFNFFSGKTADDVVAKNTAALKKADVPKEPVSTLDDMKYKSNGDPYPTAILKPWKNHTWERYLANITDSWSHMTSYTNEISSPFFTLGRFKIGSRFLRPMIKSIDEAIGKSGVCNEVVNLHSKINKIEYALKTSPETMPIQKAREEIQELFNQFNTKDLDKLEEYLKAVRAEINARPSADKVDRSPLVNHIKRRIYKDFDEKLAEAEAAGGKYNAVTGFYGEQKNKALAYVDDLIDMTQEFKKGANGTYAKELDTQMASMVADRGGVFEITYKNADGSVKLKDGKPHVLEDVTKGKELEKALKLDRNLVEVKIMNEGHHGAADIAKTMDTMVDNRFGRMGEQIYLRAEGHHLKEGADGGFIRNGDRYTSSTIKANPMDVRLLEHSIENFNFNTNTVRTTAANYGDANALEHGFTLMSLFETRINEHGKVIWGVDGQQQFTANAEALMSMGPHGENLLFDVLRYLNHSQGVTALNTIPSKFITDMQLLGRTATKDGDFYKANLCDNLEAMGLYKYDATVVGGGRENNTRMAQKALFFKTISNAEDYNVPGWYQRAKQLGVNSIPASIEFKKSISNNILMPFARLTGAESRALEATPPDLISQLGYRIVNIPYDFLVPAGKRTDIEVPTWGILPKLSRTADIAKDEWNKMGFGEKWAAGHKPFYYNVGENIVNAALMKGESHFFIDYNPVKTATVYTGILAAGGFILSGGAEAGKQLFTGESAFQNEKGEVTWGSFGAHTGLSTLQAIHTGLAPSVEAAKFTGKISDVVIDNTIGRLGEFVGIFKDHDLAGSEAVDYSVNFLDNSLTDIIATPDALLPVDAFPSLTDGVNFTGNRIDDIKSFFSPEAHAETADEHDPKEKPEIEKLTVEAAQKIYDEAKKALVEHNELLKSSKDDPLLTSGLGLDNSASLAAKSIKVKEAVAQAEIVLQVAKDAAPAAGIVKPDIAETVKDLNSKAAAVGKSYSDAAMKKPGTTKEQATKIGNEAKTTYESEILLLTANQAEIDSQTKTHADMIKEALKAGELNALSAENKALADNITKGSNKTDEEIQDIAESARYESFKGNAELVALLDLVGTNAALEAKLAAQADGETDAAKLKTLELEAAAAAYQDFTQPAPVTPVVTKNEEETPVVAKKLTPAEEAALPQWKKDAATKYGKTVKMTNQVARNLSNDDNKQPGAEQMLALFKAQQINVAQLAKENPKAAESLINLSKKHITPGIKDSSDELVRITTLLEEAKDLQEDAKGYKDQILALNDKDAGSPDKAAELLKQIKATNGSLETTLERANESVLELRKDYTKGNNALMFNRAYKYEASSEHNFKKGAYEAFNQSPILKDFFGEDRAGAADGIVTGAVKSVFKGAAAGWDGWKDMKRSGDPTTQKIMGWTELLVGGFAGLTLFNSVMGPTSWPIKLGVATIALGFLLRLNGTHSHRSTYSADEKSPVVQSEPGGSNLPAPDPAQPKTPHTINITSLNDLAGKHVFYANDTFYEQDKKGGLPTEKNGIIVGTNSADIITMPDNVKDRLLDLVKTGAASKFPAVVAGKTNNLPDELRTGRIEAAFEADEDSITNEPPKSIHIEFALTPNAFAELPASAQ